MCIARGNVGVGNLETSYQQKGKNRHRGQSVTQFACRVQNVLEASFNEPIGSKQLWLTDIVLVVANVWNLMRAQINIMVIYGA